MKKKKKKNDNDNDNDDNNNNRKLDLWEWYEEAAGMKDDLESKPISNFWSLCIFMIISKNASS